MSYSLSIDNGSDHGTTICARDEIILDALVRSGIGVAYCCRAGLCGMCKAELRAGAVEHLPRNHRALSEEEITRGYVLMCRAKPTDHCVLRPLSDLPAAADARQSTAGEVIDWRPSSPVLDGVHLIALRFYAPEALSAYRAGHWARLKSVDDASTARLACFIERDPRDPAVGRFGIAQMTDASELATRGATLRIDGPHGTPLPEDLFAHPCVIIFDAFGLPIAQALAAEAAATAPLRAKLAVVVADRTNSSTAAAADETRALLAEEWAHLQSMSALKDSVRPRLEVLSKAAQADGRRLKVLVRGSASFQEQIRRLAFGTGVRAWDMSMDSLVDLGDAGH